MQNKSAVLIFTVLLALATMYTLSFNYFSSEFEKEATEQGVYEAEQLLEAGDITEEELAAFAAERLARYKCPRLFLRRESLPRGANNKLLRRVLREEWEAASKSA